jgi:hypothetical protein
LSKDTSPSSAITQVSGPGVHRSKIRAEKKAKFRAEKNLKGLTSIAYSFSQSLLPKFQVWQIKSIKIISASR